MAKKQAMITFYLGKNKDSVEYSGRVLGLITNAEFQAILENKEVANKILTSESVKVDDLERAEMLGRRLAFAVSGKEDKGVSKTLLISGVIDKLAYKGNGQLFTDLQSKPGLLEQMNVYEE